MKRIIVLNPQKLLKLLQRHEQTKRRALHELYSVLLKASHETIFGLPLLCSVNYSRALMQRLAKLAKKFVVASPSLIGGLVSCEKQFLVFSH